MKGRINRTPGQAPSLKPLQKNILVIHYIEDLENVGKLDDSLQNKVPQRKKGTLPNGTYLSQYGLLLEEMSAAGKPPSSLHGGIHGVFRKK
jgi:hypothetical protein